MSNISLPGDEKPLAEQQDTRNIPEALQTPTLRVGLVFQLLFFLANLAVWLAKFPFTQILLPLQVLLFDPGNKVQDLTIILTIGSFFGLIVNPIAGALSDRTTSRWGRRRPWLLVGLLLSVVMLFLLAYAPNLQGLLFEWIGYQIAINIVLAALLVLIPDQVPPRQRGWVSSFTGLTIPLGIIVGSLVVTRVLHAAIQPSYFALTIFLLVVIAALMLIIPEKKLEKGDLPPFRLGPFVSSFWISPKEAPDFAWTWITRFLFIASTTAVTTYLLYFLQDIFHFSSIAAAQNVTTFNSLYGIVLILAALGSGFLSDRLERRKIFVIGAGFAVALSLLLLAFAKSWTLVVVAAPIFGLGFGVYLAVDVALITQVLPAARNRGKDLGIFNIANSLPQVLVPLLVGVTVNIFHNYTVIFLISALAAALSGVLIVRVKGVR